MVTWQDIWSWLMNNIQDDGIKIYTTLTHIKDC